MIIDSRLEFSDGQTVSASAASTNYIDLSVAGDAVNELYLVVIVDTGSDSADDGETVTAVLQSDDNSSFSSAKSETAAFDCAQTGDGVTVAMVRVPRGIQRYIRMYYTVGGTALSTDPVVTAFLTDHPQANDMSNG